MRPTDRDHGLAAAATTAMCDEEDEQMNVLSQDERALAAGSRLDEGADAGVPAAVKQREAKQAAEREQAEVQVASAASSAASAGGSSSPPRPTSGGAIEATPGTKK